jgi:hypothetical protein
VELVDITEIILDTLAISTARQRKGYDINNNNNLMMKIKETAKLKFKSSMI